MVSTWPTEAGHKPSPLNSLICQHCHTSQIFATHFKMLYRFSRTCLVFHHSRHKHIQQETHFCCHQLNNGSSRYLNPDSSTATHCYETSSESTVSISGGISSLLSESVSSHMQILSWLSSCSRLQRISADSSLSEPDAVDVTR